jgi:Domain of unknown function (DUF4387)/Acyclic terpene utilisation family protein AtuA
MPELIYRVVSVCGVLGCGYPRASLEQALRGRIDAVIADGGSAAAGSYFLSSGSSYFTREAIKRDFRHMVEAGERIAGPVIVGSCGMAGGDRNVDEMIAVAKEVFGELRVRDEKVAVIHAEFEPEVVIREFHAGRLIPIATALELTEHTLRESVIVGQMGVHPLMTALRGGAKYVLAGRSCDAALFASDMIRRGIDPGLAYHVGHILEGGALACDPGSSCDCLVAELYDDGTAIFVAPDVARRCTVHSLAARSLCEQGHPHLQFYPEGILALEKTQFFGKGERASGFRNSVFVRSHRLWPWSIKLEGARRLGHNHPEARGANDWTLHHLLQNEEIIKNATFPISYFRVSGDTWVAEGEDRPRYCDIGVTGYSGDVNGDTLSLIADAPPEGEPHGTRRLRDVALLIRSTRCGLNRLTFDIIFKSAADYEAALNSNLFSRVNVASVLGVPPEAVAGTFFVDNCNAIKLSIELASLGASVGERASLAARQLRNVENMMIPLCA